MDNNNWRPSQGREPTMDTNDWRTKLQPDSRQRIINKILDTLKEHLPFYCQEGLHELAARFEENIYTAATSQSDYLRKISLKMLSMETKSQNTMANSLPSNTVGTASRPPDPVCSGELVLMNNNNCYRRPIQGGEPTMDTSDWRTQLLPDSRQRIVNKIMDKLKHLPIYSQEGLHELEKTAARFEENIYTAATSQSEYLRKISLKMISVETKSQTTMANSLPSNTVGTSNRPPDQGSLSMQFQVHNQAQSLSMPMAANQSQTGHQLLSHNIQNSGGVQSSASLSSALPPESSLAQTSVPTYHLFFPLDPA